MNCFISREYNVPDDILKSIQEVLSEYKIQYFDLYSESLGMSLSSGVINAISNAQIVIGVMTKNASNVLFELGLAIGMGKSVFLLIDDSEYIPSDLYGMTYIKINENLKENLALPLRFFIDGKRKNTRIDYTKFYRKGLVNNGNAIARDKYLERLKKIRQDGDGIQFECLVADLFEEIKEQFATLKFNSVSWDEGYDFAVWVDALDGKVINPIKFELKIGNISIEQLNTIVKQISTKVKNQELVLVLYCDRNSRIAEYQSKVSNVVVIEFENFLNKICEYGLAEAIWYFRNIGAHERSCENDSL